VQPSHFSFFHQGHHILSFPSLQRGRIFQLKSSAVPSFLHALRLGFIAPVSYISLFFLTSFSRSPSSFFPSPSAPAPLPVSLSWTVLASTLLDVYIAAVVAIFTQMLVLSLMHIILTQRTTFEGRTGAGGVEGDAIISALEEEIKVGTKPGAEWKDYKPGEASLMGALALIEFSSLVGTSPRRRAIFADHTGKLWESVLAHMIGPIDAMTQRLLAATSAAKDERKYGKSARNQAWSVALSTLSNSFCQHFLTHPPERQTESLLVDYRFVIWSIQVLAGMVAASRTEDRYGVVQRSNGVQRTLHSLLALDLALEAYCALPLTLPSPPSTSSVLRPHPHAVISAIEGAVYQVETVFFEHLATSRFPPAYARKLQSFANFQQ